MTPTVLDAWGAAWSAWDPPAWGHESFNIPAGLKIDKPKTPAALNRILADHAKWVAETADEFQTKLEPIVAKAIQETMAWLEGNLSITPKGTIRQIQSNLRVFSFLNDTFMDQMREAGYDTLLKEFTSQFPGQFPYVQDTLDFINETVGRDVPAVEYTVEDLNLFKQFRANSITALKTKMETIAATAMQRVLLSVGGMPFENVVTNLAGEFGLSAGRARSLAETTLDIHFRTVSDRAFEIIAADVPADELLFRYAGPVDKITRPFCRRMMAADKGYTRKQIDAMDNGQIPNVFISGGGYNCRHIWTMDTRAYEKAA